MNIKNRRNNIDLDEIVDEFTPYIRKVIDNMAGSNLSYEDKEEILTDTFFVLWKNQNNRIDYLDSYIAGIARNLVKEKFKKRKIEFNIDDFENNVGYFDNIEMFSDEREKLNKLEIGYKALSKLEFEIITMFYYSSKSVKDIAKYLNLSESSVKTKLFRIRKKLKKYLM